MEGIFFETPIIDFVAAFSSVVLLIAVAAGIVLAGMAEEERKGIRLLWAEWPLTGVVEPTPAEERKVRLAA